MLIILLIVSGTGFGSGCAGIGKTEVVLVPTSTDVDGVPYSIMRLAEPVKARVFVRQGGRFVRSRNRVELPAGWMLIPPPPPDKLLESER